MIAQEPKISYSAEDIKQSYGAAKADEERYTEWVVHYCYRPLSFKVTPFFLRWGFSPSNVTFLSLILAFLLPWVGSWNEVSYLLVGLMAFLISVFDCVDGNIARVTGMVSKKGHYFDFLTDILYRVLFYLAIGIMVSLSAPVDSYLASIATECLLIAASLAIIARMCRVYASVEFFSSTEQPEKAKENEQKSNWLDDFFFPFFSGLDWALPFAVIIFGFFGLMHWILVWLVLYSVLDFVYTQYSIFSKLP